MSGAVNCSEKVGGWVGEDLQEFDGRVLCCLVVAADMSRCHLITAFCQLSVRGGSACTLRLREQQHVSVVRCLPSSAPKTRFLLIIRWSFTGAGGGGEYPSSERQLFFALPVFLLQEDKEGEEGAGEATGKGYQLPMNEKSISL